MNYQKMNKIAIILICIIFGCLLFFRIALSCIFFINISRDTHSDVAKRIESPDRTKSALLIRRHSWIDLNFYVEIKDGFFSKELHKSTDFSPDLKIDWNEQLMWSYDSSFLIMSVDNPYDGEEKYMWAYDFKEEKEYTEEALILEVLNSRNEGKENPVELRYQ